MTAQTLPGLGLSGYWSLGETGWNTGMDENLRILSVTGRLEVESRTTALPAASAGKIYIVPSSASSYAGWIAAAVGTTPAWTYIEPWSDLRAWVKDEACTVARVDSSWIVQEVCVGTASGTVAAEGTWLTLDITSANVRVTVNHASGYDPDIQISAISGTQTVDLFASRVMQAAVDGAIKDGVALTTTSSYLIGTESSSGGYGVVYMRSGSKMFRITWFLSGAGARSFIKADRIG